MCPQDVPHDGSLALADLAEMALVTAGMVLGGRGIHLNEERRAIGTSCVLRVGAAFVR